MLRHSFQFGQLRIFWRIFWGVALVVGEGVRTLFVQGKWRLIPAFMLFLILALFLVIVKAISPIAPFVYSLF